MHGSLTQQINTVVRAVISWEEFLLENQTLFSLKPHAVWSRYHLTETNPSFPRSRSYEALSISKVEDNLSYMHTHRIGP